MDTDNNEDDVPVQILLPRWVNRALWDKKLDTGATKEEQIVTILEDYFRSKRKQ